MNGLNVPTKIHRIAEWIRKHDPHICCLRKTHLRTKDYRTGKGRAGNKYPQKARIAILISDKIDFKTRAIKKDPEDIS